MRSPHAHYVSRAGAWVSRTDKPLDYETENVYNLTIEVTDHCTPLTATGPVVTGMVSVIREERRAVGHRAGKHVVSILRVTAAQHPITILV